MIRTSTQLKAKVKNLSGGDSTKAQTLIRNFMMERLLERISVSQYGKNFILKGGMLVASVVGLETRATMDIDTSVRSATLSQENAVKMLQEITSIDLDDNVHFQITKVTDIMEEHDYPGIRIMLEASLDRLVQAVKIDISTGDVITPSAIEYNYDLMFEDRSISLLAYNLETLLAEKLETIMARGIANTRMRDFYDIYVISTQKEFQPSMLKAAFVATSQKRGTTAIIPQFPEIADRLLKNDAMKKQWENYVAGSFFINDLSWETDPGSAA